MMEAARRLGVATRFVSGYLYDPALDGGDRRPAARVGAGSTHAWLQAYLPGAGWVPFDPTNNLLGGTQLIRVGVARDPSQAAPIVGQLVRRERRLPRHGRQRHGAAALSTAPPSLETPPAAASQETPPEGGVSLQPKELSARSRPDAGAAPACRAA